MNARTTARRLRQGLAWGLVMAGGLGGLLLGLAPREGRTAAVPLPPVATSAATPPHAATSGAGGGPVAVSGALAPTHPVAPPTSATSGPAAASAAGAASAAQAAGTASAAGGLALTRPARPACVPDATDPDRCGPLTLERTPVALPSAALGRAYSQAIRAEGGQPPYRFDLLEGPLPAGLALDDRGRLSGTPTQPGSGRFRVRVVDAAGAVAAQSYSLRVGTPARAASSPASAASPASAPPLGQVDLSHASLAVNAEPTARVYKLDEAQLDALKGAIAGADAAPDAPVPEPPAAPQDDAASATATGGPAAAVEPAPAASVPALPPGLAWSDAQQAQLAAIVKPILAVEYPSRSLFEAAVDNQVCLQAWLIIRREAQRLHQQAPDWTAVEARCRQSADGPATAAKSARAASAPPAVAASAAAAEQVAWPDLPGWLMPPGLRDWLAEAAVRDRLLLPVKPLPWTAKPSCHCSPPRLQQPLYAVYPAWLADDPRLLPQTMDFSLINRITYFALPVNDDLTLDQPDYWTEERTAFIRAARAHETKVDFAIYRADWGFLNTEPASKREDTINRIVDQLPEHARAMLDQELPGRLSHAKSWLPGFGEVQHLGDGLTVYFDQVPEADGTELARRFADFYRRFVVGLTTAMGRNRSRQYAINLVMTDRQILRKEGPFEVAQLFKLLKAVEDPEIVDGRIAEINNDYKRRNNVELRFLVLLHEPSGESNKALRRAIELSPALNGNDRRIFLRSVVPLLLLPQASLGKYRDDLVYMEDNFGGVGFWPAPLMDHPMFDDEQAKALRTTFGPDPGTGVGEAVCGVVCPNRWLVRLAFELLLLLWAVGFALLQWRCEWRSRYGRYALLGGIPPLLVGAALLQCDPALEALREGNAQLVALIAIPVIAALWALLKRKEDRP